MQGYLSITELSRRKKITTETLRHYDRIGLFKPDYVSPDSGYRYYSYRQCDKISTIIELRNLGLSLKEIQDYMSHRNVESSYELLAVKRDEIAERIEQLTRTQREIEDKVDRLKAALEKDPVENFSYVEYPDRYVLTAPQYRTNIDEYLYDVMILEEQLKGSVPIFATDHVGALVNRDSFINREPELSRVACIRAEEMLTDSMAKEKLTKVPAGKYLRYTGRGQFRAGCPGAVELLDYLEGNHLKVQGNIMEYSQVDLDVTDIQEEQVYVVEVPVAYF